LTSAVLHVVITLLPIMKRTVIVSATVLGALLVAIVNHAFVRRYQLGQQPIGRTVRIGVSNGERRYEMVGLVGDSAYTSPRDGMMATMYVRSRRSPRGLSGKPSS
jgi:hypothetical protein